MKFALLKQLNAQLLLWCFIASLSIVIISICLIPPILGVDDTFAQYMLEGGFPQAVIHVSYFDCSFLIYEKLFVWLHQLFPQYNIMSIVYIGIYILCATAISFKLLLRSQNWSGLLAVLIYIFFFLLPCLSRLSYTSVAGHMMAVTFFYCIIYILENKWPSWSFLLFSSLFLFLAASFRAHLILPMAAMAMPVLLLGGGKKTALRFTCMLTVLSICIVVAVFQHQQDYRKNIPEWESIKATLDTFFYISNHGIFNIPISHENPALAEKFVLLNHRVNRFDYSLYDTSLIRQYFLQVQKSTMPTQVRILRTYYWMRDILKLFLVMMLLLACAVYGTTSKKNKWIAGFMIATGMGIMFFMAFYLKVPESVSKSILLLPFLICAYLFITKPAPKHNYYVLLLSIVGVVLLTFRQVFFMAWPGKENRGQINHFISNANFINSHRDTLFIEIYGDGNFNFRGFPALCCPADYPMENICLGSSYNTELNSNTLKHFGYSSIAEALLKGQKIIMIGSINTTLAGYIQKKLGFQIHFVSYKYPDSDLLLFIPKIGARLTSTATPLPAPGKL